jgi:hypothetical protein
VKKVHRKARFRLLDHPWWFSFVVVGIPYAVYAVALLFELPLGDWIPFLIMLPLLIPGALVETLLGMVFTSEGIHGSVLPWLMPAWGWLIYSFLLATILKGAQKRRNEAKEGE